MTDLRSHLEVSVRALEQLGSQLDTIERWGVTLGRILGRGGRLLAAGNGGSAAQAQHLTAELVGRYATERRPLSAISLHAETSSLTAISNDYGPEAAFSRQVEAHGRAGDVFIGLSTSGRSPNVVAAATRARSLGLRTLALTGPGPNPLSGCCDECLTAGPGAPATVQEAHLVVIHLLCQVVDSTIAALDADALDGGARDDALDGGARDDALGGGVAGDGRPALARIR